MDSRLKLVLTGDPDEVLLLLVRVKKEDVIPRFCQVITQFGDIITCRVQRKHLLEVYKSPDTFSVKAPRILPAAFHEDDGDTLPSISLPRPSRVVNTSYSGKNIYFAAVDWGFDFAHTNFRSSNGSTRFKCIWNQNAVNDGNPYGYGSVYSEEDINRALESDTPYQTLGYHPGHTDVFGAGMHGTHVMDIAAGTRVIGEGGVAPETTLIGVQLGSNYVNGSDLALGDSVRLVEALHFIASLTQDAPCVINMSLGSHGDSHTGKSLVEIALDNFLSRNSGYAIVQSVGNYYQANCHLQHTLEEGKSYQIEWNIPHRSSSANEVEIWYPASDQFSLRLQEPGGETTAEVGPFEDIQISYHDHPVGYIFHRFHEPNTGLNHIDIILDVSIIKGKWIIELTGTRVTNGGFHAYCERNDTSQARFSPHQSSSLTTTGSVCNSQHTITAGAYDHNDILKPVVRFSSSGPTVRGRRKPDLLAPGNKISAARSAPANALQPKNLLTVKSGSSMAAPHVAGSLALLFQQHLPRRLAIAETKQLLFTALDHLPDHFPASDLVRAGRGFLNIKTLTNQKQENGGITSTKALLNNIHMNYLQYARPVRGKEPEPDVEGLPIEQPHRPYLHQDCTHCDDALLDAIKKGIWETNVDLLNSIDEDCLNDGGVNSFDLYRHFHPQYQFNHSPYENRFTPVAVPGSRLKSDLRTGDFVIMRLVLAGKNYQGVIIDPAPVAGKNLNDPAVSRSKPGYYVQAYGNNGGTRNEKRFLRIADNNALISDNILVLRIINKELENPVENAGVEDASDIKQFKLQFVKFGKGGGYMYPGDRSLNYEEAFALSNLTDFEIKTAKHFLQTEGGIDSINTYDNQVITWGFGFAGKSGNFTIALFDLFSASEAAKNDYNSFGITLTSPATNHLAVSAEGKTYTGQDALNFLKLSQSYLNILISLTQKYTLDTFLAQWRTFKKIHKAVFEAFEDNGYLAKLAPGAEKNKSKAAILHAHHHYPGFNPPGTFKDAASFEEVLKIYVSQSSRFGSVQGHADTWRKNINHIFNGSLPVPTPPLPVPVSPVPHLPAAGISASVGKNGQNKKEDVAKVQQLLHAAGLPIPVTGQIQNNPGDVTILAIYHYQKKKNLPVYDGRVDTNGPAMKSLIRDAAAATHIESEQGEIAWTEDMPVEQDEWTTNSNIHARYRTWQAYKAVRDKVAAWGVSVPAVYIEAAIGEWNANTGIHVHFHRNFDGDPRRSYLNLKRLYEAKGVSDPATYFNNNIVPITFFNRTTPGHRDLRTALDTAQTALTAAGNTFSLDRRTWSFVPRTFNKNIHKLSNHALGKAIDIDPTTNPHILSADDILVINSVCSTVLLNGLLAETDANVLRNASTVFQQAFTSAWIAQQTNPLLVKAITKRRSKLNTYAVNGFLNLPAALIGGLQNADLGWGGTWRTSKDFMHFELPHT